MRALALGLLFLLPLVAGCLVEPPLLEGQLPTAGPPGVPQDLQGSRAGAAPEPDLNLSADAIQLPAPLWQLGDAWKWSVTSPGGSTAQEFVMVGETPNDYITAATDAAAASSQAFFGRSLPGRVNKVTLSGYDQGVSTRYMDFPLQTNKTWNLHVRGTDYPVKANFTRSLEGGRGPGFVIEGASAGGDRVSLAYAPSAKWMTRFQLSDPAGGNVFQRTLTSFTANYTGPYYVATAEDLYVVVRNGTAPSGPPVEGFTQGRAFTNLHLQLDAQGAGAVDLRIVDPLGQVRYAFNAAAPTVAQEVEADLPSAPGAWRVNWVLAGPIEVRLRIAGMDVTERAL